MAVTAGQFVSASDINSGLFDVRAGPGVNGSRLRQLHLPSARRRRHGHGGVDLDQSPNTMTINVIAVNDAPSGADKTQSRRWKTRPTASRLADFGFSDPHDNPANTLSRSVKITTLPAAAR